MIKYKWIPEKDGVVPSDWKNTNLRYMYVEVNNDTYHTLFGIQHNGHMISGFIPLNHMHFLKAIHLNKTCK